MTTIQHKLAATRQKHTLFAVLSGCAIAVALIVGGVLVEVPVMLSVCAVCNRTRHWFPSEAVRREA